MYYPKSQIKTSLFTKGKEYTIFPTSNEYRGFYYQTSNGSFFSGKNPQDPNGGVKLVPIKVESPLGTSPNIKKISNVITDESYLKAKNFDNSVTYSLPTSIYPQPTSNDYQIGEFERYFLSKTNEIKFVEINKTEFIKYQTKDPNVAFQFYFPLKISWLLVGDKDKVYQVNKKTVERTESNLNLRGFSQYLKNRFLQFYLDI